MTPKTQSLTARQAWKALVTHPTQVRDVHLPTIEKK